VILLAKKGKGMDGTTPRSKGGGRRETSIACQKKKGDLPWARRGGGVRRGRRGVANHEKVKKLFRVRKKYRVSAKRRFGKREKGSGGQKKKKSALVPLKGLMRASKGGKVNTKERQTGRRKFDSKMKREGLVVTKDGRARKKNFF